jgi:hypothetical protein
MPALPAVASTAPAATAAAATAMGLVPGPRVPAAPVIELCRALDGLPLAIELAAARAPMLGVQRLAQSMHDRLKLLTAGRNRHAPARQQTLRAALEWSHGWLDERERIVFRRLAVFAGSASLPMLQRVASDAPGAGQLDEWAVLDALGVLVDRSLVAVLGGDDAADAPRYRLLESPRLYALEQLRAAGEEGLLRERHAEAVAAYLDTMYDERFRGRLSEEGWSRLMSPDLDNAREAMSWARAHDKPGLALPLVVGLFHALPRALQAERLALAELGESLALPSPADPRLQYRARMMVCNAHINTQWQRSGEAAAAAAALARSMQGTRGDAFELHLALCKLGAMAARLGELERAEAALAEAETLEDARWLPRRAYWRAQGRCLLAMAQGDADQTLHWSRAMCASGCAEPAWALVNLAGAELGAGDATAAERTCLEVLAALEGRRDEPLRGFALLTLVTADSGRTTRHRRARWLGTAWRSAWPTGCSPTGPTNWRCWPPSKAGRAPRPGWPVAPTRATPSGGRASPPTPAPSSARAHSRTRPSVKRSSSGCMPRAKRSATPTSSASLSPRRTRRSAGTGAVDQPTPWCRQCSRSGSSAGFRADALASAAALASALARSRSRSAAPAAGAAGAVCATRPWVTAALGHPACGPA